MRIHELSLTFHELYRFSEENYPKFRVCDHIEERPSIVYNNAQTKKVPVKAPNIRHFP
jgi:hypothetical protein